MQEITREMYDYLSQKFPNQVSKTTYIEAAEMLTCRIMNESFKLFQAYITSSYTKGGTYRRNTDD